MTQTTPGPSRRSLVQAGAAAALVAVVGRAPDAYAASGPQAARGAGPAWRTLPLSTNWLFGGEFTDGSDAPGHDDTAFERITLPHTVTPLSWRQWDPVSWQRGWIYRRHFDVPERFEGLRLFADFDGALSGARVSVNGHPAGVSEGGYLPFGHEITGLVTARGNVLAVELDARFGIDVPPDRPGQNSSTVDFWQPGGLYRPAYLRAVPQVFVADVFARPVDVLVTLDAAGTLPAGARTIALTGSGRTLGFLGASSSSSVSGTGTVHCTDGSTSDFPLLVESYWQAPTDGNETIAATAYCNSKGTEGRPRGRRQQPRSPSIVLYTKTTIDAGKTVAAVTLPPGSAGPGRITAIHLFAAAIG